MRILLIAWMMAAVGASGQTKVSLSNQSKDVDFSGAASTKPFRSGASLPGSCVDGEVFYLTTAGPGTSLYSCSSNTWSSVALPSLSGQSGAVLTNSGSAASWAALGGDVAGTPGSELVKGLQGIPVSSTLPVNGQALVFNAGLNRWQPGSGGTVPDWPVTRASNTTITVGTGPGVRIGNVYCQVPTTPATVTVGSGTGTIFLFIRSTCELVAAANLVISSCSGCTAVGGAGYEPDSFPIAQWSVSGGVLAAQGTSTITPYFVRALEAGPNIQLTYNSGVTQISAGNLASLHPVRMISESFDGGSSALSAGVTRYVTIPFACTLHGWNMAADQGTATVTIWKVAAGTAIPTVSNSISTAGISLAAGTSIHSTDMTDFTSVAVAPNDILGIHLSAVSSTQFLNTTLECVQ
ncbi:MAG: hypothetical protein ABL995_16130 [Bryobacteraceae bacterium]